MRFLRFLWHRDPATGILMLGHNPAIGQVLRIVGSIILLFTPRWIPAEGWRWSMFAIGAGILVSMAFGLWRNYRGRTA